MPLFPAARPRDWSDLIRSMLPQVFPGPALEALIDRMEASR